MGIKVGIDLGTTFSAVAVMDEKKGQPRIIENTMGERITPSVIQVLEDGELVVGSEAKEAFEAGEAGCASVFKRGMGNPDPYCVIHGKPYTAEDLSAILLRYLKEETEAVTGQTIDEAVVTVPAYFYHKERRATMNAARKAGLNVRMIINEPTAAALTYGANHWRENAVVMVYDLGGGTFDVTLVQMQKNNQIVSKKTLGDHTLGGKDWDNRLVNFILERISSETGLDTESDSTTRSIVSQCAEIVKKQLSQKTAADVRLNLPGYGRYSTEVTLEEFDGITRDLLERTGSLCENILRDLGITWRHITDILLVGGSTKMRQVSNYLESISGHKPLNHVNPDEAVALGAAIQAHLPLPEYIVISSAPEAAGGEEQYRFRKSLFSHQQKTKPNQSTGTNAVGTILASGPVGAERALDTALSMVPSDIVAHAMGVIAVSKDATHYVNRTIVPANQTIPVKCAESFQFYTSANGDNEVEIYVLQGTRAPLECEIIGKYVASGIRHDRDKNPTTLRIQYSYDINGMVHVQVRQEDDNFDLPIREEPVPDDMSKYGRPIDPEEFHFAEPVSVVMAVDVSGSMNGTPLFDAKKAMIHFVDQFEDYPAEVHIGVIAVSDRSLPVCHLTSNFKKCRDKIHSIEECMTGVCNAAHPFDDIKSMLKHEQGKRIGIVLADGVWENQPRAVKAAKVCHGEEIDIIGIGFGSADKKFLKDISSGSIESMLTTQSELTKSFGKIAQEIGSGASSRRGKAGGEQRTQTWKATGE